MLLLYHLAELVRVINLQPAERDLYLDTICQTIFYIRGPHSLLVDSMTPKTKDSLYTYEKVRQKTSSHAFDVKCMKWYNTILIS